MSTGVKLPVHQTPHLAGQGPQESHFTEVDFSLLNKCSVITSCFPRFWDSVVGRFLCAMGRFFWARCFNEDNVYSVLNKKEIRRIVINTAAEVPLHASIEEVQASIAEKKAKIVDRVYRECGFKTAYSCREEAQKAEIGTIVEDALEEDYGRLFKKWENLEKAVQEIDEMGVIDLDKISTKAGTLRKKFSFLSLRELTILLYLKHELREGKLEDIRLIKENTLKIFGKSTQGRYLNKLLYLGEKNYCQYLQKIACDNAKEKLTQASNNFNMAEKFGLPKPENYHNATQHQIRQLTQLNSDVNRRKWELKQAEKGYATARGKKPTPAGDSANGAEFIPERSGKSIAVRHTTSEETRPWLHKESDWPMGIENGAVVRGRTQPQICNNNPLHAGAAAFKFCEHFHFNLLFKTMPPTYLDENGHLIQLFAEEAERSDRIPDLNKKMETIADENLPAFIGFGLADVALLNVDRVRRNWMIELDNGKLIRPVAIDNDNCLPDQPLKKIADRLTLPKVCGWVKLPFADVPLDDKKFPELKIIREALKDDAYVDQYIESVNQETPGFFTPDRIEFFKKRLEAIETGFAGNLTLLEIVKMFRPDLNPSSVQIKNLGDYSPKTHRKTSQTYDSSGMQNDPVQVNQDITTAVNEYERFSFVADAAINPVTDNSKDEIQN